MKKKDIKNNAIDSQESEDLNVALSEVNEDSNQKPKKDKKDRVKFLKSRGFKHGTLATVLTVGFIVAAILLNVIATLLDQRFPLNIDLTKEKIYDLDTTTKDFIKKLESDVDITILYPESAFTPNIAESVLISNDLIKLYDKYSDKIEVKYVDIVKDPTFISKYPKHDLKQFDVVIECGDKVSVVNMTELVLWDENQQPYSSNAEAKITASLMSVTSKEQSSVAVIEGHSEKSIIGLTNLLSNNSFTVETVNLASGKIPEGTDMIIISAPTRDYSKQELKILDEFLDNNAKYGNNLIYIADPSQPELPNLKTFLNEWGIDVGRGIVYETKADYIYSRLDRHITGSIIGDTPLTEKYKDSKTPFAAPYGVPVKTLFESKDSRQTQILASYSDKSALKPADAPEDYQYSDKDQKGPFATIAVGSKMRFDQTTKITSNVVVFASFASFDENYITNPSFINGDLYASVFNLLEDKDVRVDVSPKKPMGGQITIDRNQAETFALLFKYIIPLLMLVIGTVLWFRRRHL